jgi:hypothetical protein
VIHLGTVVRGLLDERGEPQSRPSIPEGVGNVTR